MLYANDGLELMESIEISLNYLNHLAQEEPNESRVQKILAFRKDRLEEYQDILIHLQTLASRLDYYADEI